MSDDQTNNQPQVQNPLIEVESLDDFVKLLFGWHTSQVAVLKHMMSIPEGTTAQNDDEPPVILEGETRRGFILGLQLALRELGTLPFEAEIETTEPGSTGTEEATQASADFAPGGEALVH